MNGIDLTLIKSYAGWGVGIGVGLVFLAIVINRFLFICRPNELLIFSGRKTKTMDGRSVGYRVLKGGFSFRRPFIEQVSRIDMCTIPIPLETQQAYSKDGIPLHVRAIANVKVASDLKIVGNAIERFLGRGRSEIRNVAKETLEGTLRGVLATLTPEEVNEDRLKFADQLAEEVSEDFHKLGLQLDTLKIQHVTDDTQYLDSIGRAKIAEVIKNAEIAESNAQREASQRASDAKARGEVAKENAEKTIAQKRNEQQKWAAEFKANVQSALHEANAAGEQARYEAQLELQKLRRELAQLKLEAEVEIPAEMQRRASELQARGAAAPIEQNGRALAEALQILATAWAEAGPHAKDVFLIQQVEQLMRTIVGKMSALNVDEVHLIDPGDGSALPNYVAGFPSTVTSVLKSLRETTGIDVTSILNPDRASNGAASLKSTGSSHLPSATV